MFLLFQLACLNTEMTSEQRTEINPLFRKLQDSGKEEMTLEASSWLQYSQPIPQKTYNQYELLINKTDLLWLEAKTSLNAHLYLLDYTRNNFTDHFEKLAYFEARKGQTLNLLDGFIAEDFKRGALLVVASREPLPILNQWSFRKQIECKIEATTNLCLRLKDIATKVPSYTHSIEPSRRCGQDARCAEEENQEPFLSLLEGKAPEMPDFEETIALDLIEDLEKMSMEEQSLKQNDNLLSNKLSKNNVGTGDIVVLTFWYKTR